jgi:hypothetical protein
MWSLSTGMLSSQLSSKDELKNSKLSHISYVLCRVEFMSGASPSTVIFAVAKATAMGAWLQE